MTHHLRHSDIAMTEKDMGDTPLYVRKEDSSKELFNQKKLFESLVKSGAEPMQAEKIVHQVVDQVSESDENITTAAEIYNRAYGILKNASRVVAARYSLRRSLLEFGPTGFPFEKYIAELLKAKWGYETLVGQIVLGGCVPHEVDVIAWDKNKLIMAEVKYHSDAGSKTDLKVALYVKARYQDLDNTVFEYGHVKRHLGEGWLITNTRFTETAINYAECQGVKMLSWDYPLVDNLQQLIEFTQLHPITCLASLQPTDKRLLMDNNIVLVKSLFDHKDKLRSLGMDEKQIEELLDEASEVLKTRPAN